MRRIETSLAGAALMLLAGTLTVTAQSQPGTRMSGLQISGNQPIEIESDRLEVRENDNIAIFTGNVSVVQGETLLKSGKMVVHYAPGGGGGAMGSSEIERIEVEEKVYVESEGQVATGDQGTFNMRTEIMELSGRQVVLTEGDTVVVGCKLVVHMATGEAKLDGCRDGDQRRVRMLLKPRSQ